MLPGSSRANSQNAETQRTVVLEHPHAAQQPKVLGNLRSPLRMKLAMNGTMAPAVANPASPACFWKKRPGKITVNGKDIQSYFGRETSIMIAKQPWC